MIGPFVSLVKGNERIGALRQNRWEWLVKAAGVKMNANLIMNINYRILKGP